MRAYNDLGARNALKQGGNPVKMLPLVVNGHNGEVVTRIIEECGVASVAGDACHAAAVCNQEVPLWCSQVTHLHHELADARTEVDREMMIMKHKLARMSNNINCLSNSPPAIVVGGDGMSPCLRPTSSTFLLLLKELLQSERTQQLKVWKEHQDQWKILRITMKRKLL